MNTLPAPATSPASPHLTSPSLLGLIPSAAKSSAPFIIFAALVLILNGCATTPLDRAAKSLASTVQTVDVAMQGYAVAVALDAVSLDDQAKLKKIYADYQAAVALAETAITNAINSGDAGSLAAATAALDASKFQLLAFLARFTTSPPKP